MSGQDGGPGARLRPYLVLLVVGGVLFFPLLGWYGLWDPHEVRIAEIAREMAHDKTFAVPQRYPGKPALLLAAISLGYRTLGNSELAGRLPVALLSLSALFACYYAGSSLLRRRAALMGALALATMPVIFLGARQLTSAVAPVLAGSLAIGGLGRFAWSRRGDQAVVHLFIGAIGLMLGVSAAGFALGVAVPVVALAVSLWAASPASAPQASSDAAPVDSDDEPAPRAGMMLTRGLFSAAALAAVGLVIYAWQRALPGGVQPGYSWVLSGIPRQANHLIQATTLLKQVGFGAFPWIALAPLALTRLFVPSDERPAGGRDDFARYLLSGWALTAYIATTLYVAAVGETSYAAYPALALLAGAFLDDVWEAASAQALAAVVAASLVAIVAHDFFMAPEGFAGAHVLEGIKWPPLVAPQYIVLVGGLLWAALIAAAVMAPRDAGRLVPARSSLLAGSLGLSLALALTSVYFIIPEVSKHLSYKNLFVKYKSLVGTGQSEIGKYHVPGQLSDYAQTTDLTTLPQMFDFLGKSARVFVITAADDLPAIDQYAKQRAAEPAGRRVEYYVIDDSNSKFLMLSNQLGDEPDKNPLRRFVVPVDKGLPRPPEHMVNASFEGKVELIGYDLPPDLERGKPFTWRAYYKVNQPLGGAYKVFLHFDGPGTRFNGDHVPLEGKFAANYWVPGHYIIDEYKVTPEKAQQPIGLYTIYTGFWLGDQRLKVTTGAQDGENRVRAGNVRVR